jgi:hypothetical protein
MKETKCEVIRRELDELMLDDECSIQATQHLQECDACREFQQKQIRLRQMVGSLGTVAAPADFDFRLRARLANESTGARFHLKALQWPFATRGIAVAAMLLLFAGGLAIVLNLKKQQGNTVVANRQDPPPAPRDEQIPQPPRETGVSAVVPDQPNVTVSDNRPRTNRGEHLLRPKRSLAARDSAIEGAQVYSDSQRHAAIFPIDASLQSLKVSIDDGHGNARTISVPTLSFGSQRVLATGNQFAPKGVW